MRVGHPRLIYYLLVVPGTSCSMVSIVVLEGPSDWVSKITLRRVVILYLGLSTHYYKYSGSSAYTTLSHLK
jgi:hypothetical protein